MPGRYPPVLGPLHLKGTIKGRLEAVGGEHAQVHFIQMLDGRQHDLWSKREGSDHGPGSDRAIVGAIGYPARQVIEEPSLDALHRAYRPTRAVAGRDPPATV